MTEPHHPDHNARTYVFTTEEIDAAVELLERLITAREREQEALNLYMEDVKGGPAVNVPLRKAVEQLRSERWRRAIPEAVLDAALGTDDAPGAPGALRRALQDNR